jgi:hypothetical protein
MSSYLAKKYLVYDNSTLANFLSWGSGISSAIASMGWIQGNDTGQVVFTATVITFTQVTLSGATAVYAYSSYTGPAPRVGMNIIVSGFVSGGNNVAANLTAVSGGASGTVTFAFTTQSNETHAGSGTTTVSTAPASNAFGKNEIWKPGDGGPSFFLRVSYGNTNANGPRVQMQIGSSTDGACTLTGFTTQVFETIRNDIASGGATVPYECIFSGDTDRIGMILWRQMGSACHAHCVERTRNADGTNSGEGVTLLVAGPNQGASFNTGMQTMVFGIGAAPKTGSRVFNSPHDGVDASYAFNGKIPIFPVYPLHGRVGNPMTMAAWVHHQEIGDGALFTTTLYGSPRTYITAVNVLAGWPNFSSFCLRYD